ncbi:hypothetical protein BZA05DRAFT_394509 [Tricharina praecox]|uniref:uncharacterized protein n=1 Tax=Tricharina praecox TaxID=43433 RepID=UPI0022209CEB|nr:uncharacterized protein BZA05DRAFT_394509 [Tricharina praecox]KAI5853729.1 hypothetical protein BZA05DRAFT_394509 [Tricharina praecox]
MHSAGQPGQPGQLFLPCARKPQPPPRPADPIHASQSLRHHKHENKIITKLSKNKNKNSDHLTSHITLSTAWPAFNFNIANKPPHSRPNQSSPHAWRNVQHDMYVCMSVLEYTYICVQHNGGQGGGGARRRGACVMLSFPLHPSAQLIEWNGMGWGTLAMWICMWVFIQPECTVTAHTYISGTYDVHRYSMEAWRKLEEGIDTGEGLYHTPQDRTTEVCTYVLTGGVHTYTLYISPGNPYRNAYASTSPSPSGGTMP